MLPTFVIGLREGLEAALIVGIIAAFLRKQGRPELVRWMLAGIGAAVALCAAVGVGLQVLSRDLPQRQQEGLETVVGALAVVMVTYLVVWMKRHARELKAQLEGRAAQAMTGNGARAMVLMAFLAVLREGFETVVFLLAAFNESGSGVPAGIGALSGIAAAVLLGYGIYRGGVRINLARFFRATGLVLVLVAAGLVATALHTAHEAGWLARGQSPTVDLSGLARPGSVQSSLLTGMLGVQPHPVLIEVVGWLLYLVPAALFVAWPAGRGLPRRAQRRGALGLAALAGAAAAVLALLVPAAPGASPGGPLGPVLARDGSAVRAATSSRLSKAIAGASMLPALHRTGTTARSGVPAVEYAATVPGGSETHRLTLAAVARLNGGRLPIGLEPAGPSVEVRYARQLEIRVWLARDTGRLLDAVRTERVTAAVGRLALARPVSIVTVPAPASATRAAAAAARADHLRSERHDRAVSLAWTAGLLALAGLAWAAGAAWVGRRRTRLAPRAPDAPPQLVLS